MKAQKILNILLMLLIILLISIISFVGIFTNKQAKMANLIPDYQLGINLKGYRAVSLEIKDEVEKEEEGIDEVSAETDLAGVSVNSVETKETAEENATDENETNETESNSLSNAAKYAKNANIFRKRLKKIGVEDYTVTVDSNTGKIDITLPENEKTDTILSDLDQIGNFKILDADTEEVLITNADIKTVDITTEVHGTDSKGEPITYIYMTINFNLEGASKFKDLTKLYQNIVPENETTEESEENAENKNAEENTAQEETSENKKHTQVTLRVDDTDLMSTYFTTINDTGSLSLTVGNSAQSVGDFDTMIVAAENLASIMENDPLDYQYEVNTNVYINTTLDSNKIKLIAYIEIAIALLIALVIIAKYRLNGLAATISSVGFVALLLLAIRFGNVRLTLEGIFTIELVYIMNMIFNLLLLKRLNKEDLTSKERLAVYKESMKKYLLILMPVAIIVIAFTIISSWGTLNSIGLVLFLGGAISAAYNAIVSYIYIRSTNKQ